MNKKLFKWEVNGELRKLTMGGITLATLYLMSSGNVEVTMNPDFFGKKGGVKKNLRTAEDYVTNIMSELFSGLHDKFYQFVLLHNEARDKIAPRRKPNVLRSR